MRLGRRDIGGVRIVRGFELLPASQVPLGPVTFDTSQLARLKHRAGVGVGSSAAGVRILVLDVDAADPDLFPDDVSRPVESRGGRPAADGHGTLVAAVVAAVAPDAEVHVVGLRDEKSGATWRRIHNEVAGKWEFDIIVAALTLSDEEHDPGSRSDRDVEIEEFFRGLACSPIRPVMLFPTGNDEIGEIISTISAPARVENVIAIGSVDSSLALSKGSRYGRKTGAEPSRWWVAPGGSFTADSEDDSFVFVNGRPCAGTSVAVAFAAGVVAVCVAELRDSAPTETSPWVQTLDESVQRLLAASEENELVARRQGAIVTELAAVAKGARGRAHLIRALERNARGVALLPDFSPSTHGRGLIAAGDPILPPPVAVRRQRASRLLPPLPEGGG